MIEMIVAHDKNRVIGKDNSLIWHISEDLKYFKKITTGKKVVMGRKTYESIGKLLPNRENIILTRDTSYELEGATVYNSLDKLIEENPDFIVIGGSEIYNIFLLKVDKLYATEIDYEFDGDAFFPDYKESFVLKETSEIITEKDGYKLNFNVYNKPCLE